VALKRNDGVGNVPYIFPYKYDDDPHRVYGKEGSILLKDKNFASNPRILNPFLGDEITKKS